MAKPGQLTFAVERVDGLHAQLEQLLAKLGILGHGRHDAEEMLVLALHAEWSSFGPNWCAAEPLWAKQTSPF